MGQNDSEPGLNVGEVVIVMTPIRASYSATASVVISTPGTYTVGMCVRNNGGPSTLSENDYVNGWVMVVD